MEQPIELKIQKLQRRLNDLGVKLPDTQRGQVLKNKIEQIEPLYRRNAPLASTNVHNTARNHHFENSDNGVTDSIMKSVMSNGPAAGQFVPPYGGHTKTSIIRQEISNYEHSVRGYDTDLTPRDI
jgi:hypothetical protein